MIKSQQLNLNLPHIFAKYAEEGYCDLYKGFVSINHRTTSRFGQFNYYLTNMKYLCHFIHILGAEKRLEKMTVD